MRKGNLLLLDSNWLLSQDRIRWKRIKIVSLLQTNLYRVSDHYYEEGIHPKKQHKKNPSIWSADQNMFSLSDIQTKNFYNWNHCKEFDRKSELRFRTLNIQISLSHKLLQCIWSIQLDKLQVKGSHLKFFCIPGTLDIKQAPSLDNHKECLDMSLPEKCRCIFTKYNSIVRIIHLNSWFLLMQELSLKCLCLNTLRLRLMHNQRGRTTDRELQIWTADSYIDSLLHK